MRSNNFPISRKSNLVMQELPGEILLYDTKIDKAFCLNETSAAVWQFCNGNNSITDISLLLSKKLRSSVTEDFVRLAIEQFKKDDLLENGREIQTNFEGLSRREVIRKVGFASMIALPVISSLVAPSATMAQSALRTIGQACTTSSQCAASAPNCTNSMCCVGAFGTPSNSPTPFQAYSPATCPNNTDTQRNVMCNTQNGNACCSGSATYNGFCSSQFVPTGSNFTCRCL